MKYRGALKLQSIQERIHRNAASRLSLARLRGDTNLLCLPCELENYLERKKQRGSLSTIN